MALKEEIIADIKQTIHDSGHEDLYREPLVGFVSAQNPGYDKLPEILGHEHMHPTEILPGAQTVIVYFLPFNEALGKLIQGDRVIVTEWSQCYTVTNDLLSCISDHLVELLQKKGYQATGIPPTNNYDAETLTSKWSHKSSAVLAGIGSFGLNRLLITEKGTMGRLNTTITNAYVEPSEYTGHQYCLYYQTGKCKVCLERCPSGAISEHGIDKFRCNAYLDGKFVHWSRQGCPMCSSGPCACRGF